MIAILLEGRLGNQLFQFAFIYLAAKKKNSRFFINQSIEKLYLSSYFDINSYLFNSLDQNIFKIKGFKNFFSFHFRRFFYHKANQLLTPNRIQENNLEWIGDEMNIKDSTCYQGYFQNFTYYKNHQQEIKDLFKIKANLFSEYQSKYQFLLKDKKIITIHIRRGDYLHLPQLNLGKADLSLPASYYHQLIQKYQNEANALFIFIGDDKEFMNKEFASVKNKWISDDNEINDFLHLKHADIIISSNSTFSWWGAFLNQKENKIIHCPKYFLGFHIQKEYPANIYPPDWIQHEVIVKN